MAKMVRIQFETPEEKARELEVLMEESGVRTKKDLFNYALTLLEWAIRERKEGRIIASVDEKEKKYKEILMPPLSMTAKK